MASNLNPIKIINWLLHPSSRIQQRVAHAAIWSFGSRFGERFIEYVRLIILARLLAPQDFGLMGIGLIAISALESVTKSGFAEAVIQKKGNAHDYLDVLWTESIIKSVLVAVALALFSPLIASFFDAPDAQMILLAMAGAVVFNGFINPAIVLLQRDLEFHRVSVSRLIPILTATVVSLVLAFAFRNVWALVFGLAAKNLAMVAVSYWVHPYRPRLSRQVHKARELFSFGKWVYLQRILNFTSSQADSIMLGSALGTVNLGLYQMAQRTSIIPLREIPRGITDVAFPMYSRIQTDLRLMRKAFLGVIEFTTSLALPLAVIIFLFADDIVMMVLGEKWIQAAPAMRFLALAGFVSGFINTGGALFNGVGKPWINMHVTLVRAVAMVALIYPMTRAFGLEGAAATVLIGSGAGFVLYFYHSLRILSLSIWGFIRALVPALISTSVIVAATLGINHQADIRSVQALLGIIALAGLLYLSIYVLTSWKMKSNLFSQFAPKFMGIKS